MPEYIEREALKEDIKNHFKKLIDEGYVYDEIFESNAEILRIIDAQPTADVVEVVYCKECKHLYCSSAVDRQFYCRHHLGMKGCLNVVEENPYCSYGEQGE